MRPIEPLCSWFRHLTYDGKYAKTLRGLHHAPVRALPGGAGPGAAHGDRIGPEGVSRAAH
jgi:hypothetical protein